jgi:hypothetical protein
MGPRVNLRFALSNRSEYEESVVVLGCGLSFIALFWGLPWALFVFSPIMVAGLLLPRLAFGLHVAWSFLGMLLSSISGTILLGVMFFGILTPLAWIRRVFGTSHFRKKDRSSFFDTTQHTYGPKDLENPW